MSLEEERLVWLILPELWLSLLRIWEVPGSAPSHSWRLQTLDSRNLSATTSAVNFVQQNRFSRKNLCHSLFLNLKHFECWLVSRNKLSWREQQFEGYWFCFRYTLFGELFVLIFSSFFDYILLSLAREEASMSLSREKACVCSKFRNTYAATTQCSATLIPLSQARPAFFTCCLFQSFTGSMNLKKWLLSFKDVQVWSVFSGKFCCLNPKAAKTQTKTYTSAVLGFLIWGITVTSESADMW